jgi:hypothetical protein
MWIRSTIQQQFGDIVVIVIEGVGTLTSAPDPISASTQS